MRAHPGLFEGDEVPYYSNLLTEVLKQLTPPADFAAMVLGSVAEGFSNPRSDIDLLFVVDGERAVPVMRTMIYVLGRRIEVFYRNRKSLEALATEINRLSEGEAALADVAKLHEYQTLTNGCVLVDQNFLRSVRALFDAETIGRAAASYFAAQSVKYLQQSLGDCQLSRGHRAVTKARYALIAAAKSWAASRGETYLRLKWVDFQLERLGAPRDLLLPFTQLSSGNGEPSDAAEYVESCRRAIEAFGIPSVDSSGGQMYVVRRPEVSEWDLGGRTYLLRGESELFALSSSASRLWKAAEWERPFAECAQSQSPPGRRLMGELHDQGLVVVHWGEEASLWEAAAHPPPDLWEAPFVSAMGAHWQEPQAEDSGHVRRLPLPARAFVFAGTHLFWAQVMLDNAWEDYEGGLAAEDWRVVGHALRSVACVIARMIALGYGMAPIPSDAEISSWLFSFQGLDRERLELIRRLEFFAVGSREGALEGRDLAHRLLASLPEALRAESMRGSHEDKAVWDRILGAAFDWMKLANRVDSPLPMPEGRELLTFFFKGRQPMVNT